MEIDDNTWHKRPAHEVGLLAQWRTRVKRVLEMAMQRAAPALASPAHLLWGIAETDMEATFRAVSSRRLCRSHDLSWVGVPRSDAKGFDTMTFSKGEKARTRITGTDPLARVALRSSCSRRG